MAKKSTGDHFRKSSNYSRQKKQGATASQQEASHSQTASCNPERFPIVGIGASAGGLHSLKEFFSHLTDQADMAFVIISHQDPDHKSMLPELLGNVTGMPVLQVDDVMRVEPNHVYIGPPKGQLAILNGTLQTIQIPKHKGQRLGIDYFFRSLAEDQREHAICIILSGMGTDGTLGLRAIKAEAGMAMVEQPHSAHYAGMPSSAVATGLADFVVPVAKMPEHLLAYVSGGLRRLKATEEEDTPRLPHDAMQKMFVHLRDRTGHDFSAYKSNTLRRRIERRMAVHQIEDYDQFVRYLQENPREIDLLFKELLISVTNFFRDPDAWEALGKVLMDLVNSHSGNEPLRAWVPGCATGEEAFSLAIVLQECLEQADRKLDVTIFATDLDAEAIDTGRNGQYSEGISIDVSPERLDRFFTHGENAYSIGKNIRQMVKFAPQNVISDPPFSKLDILCCRNLLIYLDTDIQKKLLQNFHYALKPNGLLLLGPSETIGSFKNLFVPVDARWKIFRRKRGASALHRLSADAHLAHRSADLSSASKEAPQPGKEVRIATVIERWLLSRFAPAALVVDDRGDIFYVHGILGSYLIPSGDTQSNNVLQLARGGLKEALTEALRECRSEQTDILREGIQVEVPGETFQTDFSVARLRYPESVRGLLLVTFHPKPESPDKSPEEKPANRNNPGDGERILQLEQELQFTRQSQQSTLEDLESSFEELQSTNEELQSINEELETSKEEMQSMNEELTTVNSDLQLKIDELSQSNDDMQNLLNSTDIATVFLDTDLNIKRFTEHARELVRLRPVDVGRPISDLASNLINGELESTCQKVLKTLAFHESEVHTEAGNWYLMRVLPYRTTENVIAGLVVTFINIRKLKEAEATGKLRAFFESVVDTVRQPLLVLDDERCIRLANRCFCETFDLPQDQLIDSSLWDICDGSWNDPELHHVIEQVLPQNRSFEDFKLEGHFSRAGPKQLLLNARRLEREPGLPGMILLAIEDLTPHHP